MMTNEHILIVDDQSDNVIILQRMLQRAGYTVSCVDSGMAALEFVATTLPDLILLDIMMPEMDGYATLQAIRARPQLPFIPIMFVTAKQTTADTVTGLDSGADDYVVKPFNREELLARMRVLLRLKQTRRDLQREREHLSLLYTVSQKLHRSLDVDQVLVETLDTISLVLGAVEGSMILLDGEGRIWRKVLLRQDLTPEEENQHMQEVLRDSLAAHTIVAGEVQIVSNADSDPRWKHFDYDNIVVGSALALPLRDHTTQRMTGAFVLTHPQYNYFSTAIEPLAAAIADQISVALTNAAVYTRLREAEDSREGFIQMLTHDLRAPLAGMIGCFDALRTTSLDDDGSFFVDLGLRAGSAQRRLIDDLLDVYKAEAGQLTLNLERTSLGQLGAALSEHIAAAAVEAGLEFRLDLPAAPSVQLDAHKITRVLANLVSNSIKWTPRGGSVAVAGGVDESEGLITLAVRDTGHGIPAEDIPHIFEKFYQGRTRAASRGTGLGLTFCALAVRAHGGTIAVDSTVGESTTMIIRLPWKE